MNSKIVLISGASKGLGLSLAAQLIDQGCKVALCARNIQSMVDLINQKGLSQDRYYIKSVDVNSEAEICAFIDEASDKLGVIDTLINNVGMNPAKANIYDISTADFDAMYAVNMRAPMIFTREITRLMRANKTKGAVVNIHTTCDLFSNPGVGSYTASKAGFDALSKVFRKELRDDEIKVLNVYPGGIDTEFRSADRPDYLRPEQVAQSIIAQLQLPVEIYLDELVLRPLVERNF